MGNIGSLQNMIKRVGGKSEIADSREKILKSDKLLLPGVGSFDNAINKLSNLNWIDALNKKVLVEKKPILCICLGIQLITESSEEGVLPGLGWLKARTVKFNFTKSEYKIPHMGWNTIEIKKENKLLINIPDEPRFYFVHSYYVKCMDERDILATTNYVFDFVSAIAHKNIFATQFHPEKSHKYGMCLIKNFIKL